MTVDARTDPATGKYLLARAGTWVVALSVHDTAEIMRPLPIEPVAGAPGFLLGLSVIRGAPVPVIDLGAALGSLAPGRPGRYVLVRVADRRVALAVDEVLGVRDVDSATLGALPPLVPRSEERPITAIGVLDRQLLVVLSGARLMPDESWRVQ